MHPNHRVRLLLKEKANTQMKITANLALMTVLGGALASAQNLDSSGNGLLKGAFRFRQVAILNYDQNGFVTQVRAAFGTISFDGAGNYSVAGNYIDNTKSSGASQALTVTGTYVIGANGTGYIANPLAPTNSADWIYGAVAQGAFTGSTTEETQIYLNDLFVAIPAGSPTNSSFTSPYWIGVMDFTNASDQSVKNGMFQLTPNGSGGLGTITVTGQDYNAASNPVTQTTSGATYSFAADGTGTMNIPAPNGTTAANALFAPAAKTFFVSSDGNLLLGWTPTGYDIFIGVKAISGASNATFQGLYYTGTIDDTSNCGVDTSSGSIWSARGDGNSIVHERISYPICVGVPFDYVSDNFTQLSGNGTTANPDYSGYLYAFGPNGQTFVSVGSNGVFSLGLGLHSNNFSGTGVYLYPIGVFNAASYAPITAALAPGELITLFGSNLANSTTSVQGGQVFPTSLGGVQVTINGTQCPIYFVSPNQISVIVPYGTKTASLPRRDQSSRQVATIQVNNNGTLSNTVTMYMTDALPGVFTQDQTGIGLGAALHGDGSLITAANPAKPGETISVFLTGLGTVTPTINDGALGGTNPLNQADQFTSNNLAVNFDDFNNNSLGNQATITYAGLAPGLAGLYQLNVTVPSTGVGPCIPSSTAVGCYLAILTDAAYI